MHQSFSRLSYFDEDAESERCIVVTVVIITIVITKASLGFVAVGYANANRQVS